jgi:hypothetical protein
MRAAWNRKRVRAASVRRSARHGGALLSWSLGLLGLLLLAAVLEWTRWRRLSRAVCPRWRTDIAAIVGALEEYHSLHGAWPEDLTALVLPDEQGHRLLDRRTLPLDAWRREYRYDPRTEAEPRPRVYTLGADGEAGGSGHDSDHDSWSLFDESP